MITPDNTVLISRHRHDFVQYTDKNGVYYMIDGGVDYTRWSGDGQEKFITITTEDKFEIIRDNFARYNRYSKEYVKLKDISDSWLQNLIDYYIVQGATSSPIFRLFIEEKLLRAENEIYVPEDDNYQLDYA